MFKDTQAFSGFSVDDLSKAKQFYSQILGLEVSESNGMLRMHIAGGTPILVYPKPNHIPATFTPISSRLLISFPLEVCISRNTKANSGRMKKGFFAAEDH
jgi:catechol 2,3-dioxygenase-like lactoylglutathione lyase family enzyme